MIMRSWLLPPPLVENGSTIRACRIILSVNRYYNTTSGSPLPDLSLLTSEVLTPPSIKPLLSNTNDSIHLIAGQVKPKGQQTCPSTWSPTPVTSLANPSPLLWGHPPPRFWSLLPSKDTTTMTPSLFIPQPCIQYQGGKVHPLP